MTAVAGPGDVGPGSGTVLVVDDHEMVRAALVVALRAQGIAAHACAETTLRGIAAEAAALPAGVALLDLDLGLGPDGRPIDGVGAVGMLRAAGWSVLVVSGSTGRRLARVAAAIAAGAIGHVPKTGTLHTLVDVVLAVVGGAPAMTYRERQAWLELDRTQREESRRRSVLLDRLTARERFVLERLADGHRPTEIAGESVVSVSTVRSQIRAILAKLEVSSQLVAVAMVRAQDGG